MFSTVANAGLAMVMIREIPINTNKIGSSFIFCTRILFYGSFFVLRFRLSPPPCPGRLERFAEQIFLVKPLAEPVLGYSAPSHDHDAVGDGENLRQFR